MLKINPQATPELLRRARAEWSIENLELKANQTQVGFHSDLLISDWSLQP